MAAALALARHFVNRCLDAGNEPVRQRTFADTGLADENARLAGEPRPERVDAVGEPLARAEDRVTDANVVLQDRGEGPGGVIQIGLVRDDAGRKAIPCRRCEVSVAEAEVWRRHRGDNRDELRQVGCDGLGSTPRVDAGEQISAWQYFDDEASAGLGVCGSPVDVIAADDRESASLQPAMDSPARIVRDARVPPMTCDDAACEQRPGLPAGFHPTRSGASRAMRASAGGWEAWNAV